MTISTEEISELVHSQTALASEEGVKQPQVDLGFSLNSGEDVTLLKSGGVLKQLLREGNPNDKPYHGDTVFVHYTGILDNGTKFDSSRDRGEKFSFKIGEGSVIKGWDEGVIGMNRGELARFIIKPAYGYGSKGSPPTIPGGAILIFEIELFDFEGEDLSELKDKSIVRRITNKGYAYTTPNDAARCVVNLRGTLDGKVFDQRDNLEFEIGEGQHKNIIDGIEYSLTKMKKEEQCILYIKSSRAWGSTGCKEFNIPPNTDVTYEVELKNFEKAKESWQLNWQEKISQSELLKNKGTELFKEAKYALSIKKYNKIVEYLASETFDLETDKEIANKLVLAAYLNLAMCNLKLKEYNQVIEVCKKALELDDKNEKGLFRMAQAYFGNNDFEEAIKYFNKVLEVNKDSKDAANQILFCKQKIKESTMKEKALYSKMLSAFSK